MTAPDHVAPGLVRSLDIHEGPEFLADPYRVYDALREDGPIHYSDTYGGFWIVTDPHMIREVFTDSAAFHNSPLGIPAVQAWPRKLIPAELEPPEHTEFRQVLAPHFGPAAVSRLEPRIRSHCTRLLDAIDTTVDVDFVAAVSRPLPALVLGELFGLPSDDLAQVAGWVDASIHGTDIEDKLEAGVAFVTYFTELISSRQDDPGDDLLSVILNSQVAGRPVTADETLDMVMLIVGAGLDTIVSTLADAVRHLAERPEHRERLQADPELLPAAIEELLRIHPQALPARWVARDMDFHGVQFAAGDRVLPPLCAATRDPAEFDRPTEVVLDRETNRHIAFGVGIRRCLGSHLARLELRVALEEILSRWETWQITDPRQIQTRAGVTIGIDRLPLRITPRS